MKGILLVVSDCRLCRLSITTEISENSEVYMNAHSAKIKEIENYYKTSESAGLKREQVEKNRRDFGKNEITARKKKTVFKRFLEALSEPTLIILEFAWVITLGINIGKFVKNGSCDVYECVGIFVAILISACLTVFMEGRSEKAFELLGSVYDKISVKVIRDGRVTVIPKEEIVVGDLVILETGDKIVADGRLVECNGLKTDESTLTGESNRATKAVCVVKDGTPLAERRNCVYSGTFASQGAGKMIVTAVGDNAELGKIAGQLGGGVSSAPLNEKLAKLGKKVTIIGAVAAGIAFILSVLRLSATENLSFFSVQDAFVEAIVLIVAAVPEGLPTTAAISLSLNVLKLAKSNALIRKLVAAETVGCVSVICSDKTGTLTENDMRAEKIKCEHGEMSEKNALLNFAVNSTAVLKFDRGDIRVFGSATEGALLKYALKVGVDYEKLRDKRLIGRCLPFNSDNKYMATEYFGDFKRVIFLKGAPEKILPLTGAKDRAGEILREINAYQKKGKRVIAFARKEIRDGERNSENSGGSAIGKDYPSGSSAVGKTYPNGGSANEKFCPDGGLTIEEIVKQGGFTYDGYAVIADPVRRDVKKSVEACKKAGIEVKMMTGDNAATAQAIAFETGLIDSPEQVVMASEIEAMPLEELKDKIRGIGVIARSTPSVKLKVVEALKMAGAVVAVTGDGVNDAPAIKHADIGIAMGSGSEITKEASDIVLLDDSFSTIVKAVSFGRNIYRNFQRFITFQLTVNVTAMLVVIVSLALGLVSPFNAVQLLWIDIIMDGPPALTLGLEKGGSEVLKHKPVKRTDEILTKKMMIRVVVQGAYMATLIILEYLFDFLRAGRELLPTTLFCMFVMFQLFNAFNCRKLSGESIFESIGNNKLMLVVFGVTFAFQILITQNLGGFFKTEPLSFALWLKIIGICSTCVLFSEVYKLFYRLAFSGKKRGALSRQMSERKIAAVE